jgi:hypothetical protein
MITKETYTKIFLKQLEKSTDPANVKLHLHKWWQSHRSKKEGGLRLSDDGYWMLTNDLNIKEYEIPFSEPIELSPQTIIFLDQYMDCPYYLTTKSITVFSERKHFEIYMFSDDIRRYGLVKAMKNRIKEDFQNDEED